MRRRTAMITFMDIDRNSLEVLDPACCRRLLAQATIGRVGLTAGTSPMVLPVNFLLTDDGIVFRTGRGTKLDAATQGSVVAFEVDDIDPLSHTGWSVVVTGTAQELSSLDDLERLRSLPVAHWSRGEADRYVCISTDRITGRRITPA
jgi:nitroimidazol reductase NimA-like FMN-containing flavoprotein (pyridoxamine 5'-phosphate oxidase superfamily)